MNLMFWMLFPFMAIYFSNTFGKQMAGTLLVASQVVSVVVGLLGGYCADRFGRRRMMIFAAIGQTICFIFFAAANSPWLTSPWLTFFSFSVQGLFGALYWPASHAMVADVVPEKHRSNVFAVFYTSINITVVLGPIIGGILFFSERFGLLVACILISLIQTILLYKFIRETAPKRKQKVVSDRQGKRNWVRYLADEMQDYKVITTDKLFLLFIIAGILVAQTFMQLDLLIAVYTNDFVPLQKIFSIGHWIFQANGKQAFSWLVAENGLLVALFTVVMSRWMIKFKEKHVFTISSIFYGVGIIIFGHSINLWVLFGGMVIFTCAELMVVGIQESFVSKLAPDNMRGQYFAASSLRFTIGRSIAPMAIPLTVWIGFSWTFNILGILAFASGLLYMVMFNLYDKKKSKESMTVNAAVR